MSPNRMSIKSLLNPSNTEENANTNENNDHDENDDAPQTPQGRSTSYRLPVQPDGPPTASLPGQLKGKGKRQASNSPHPDSPSIALRRKRTKPTLQISPAAANNRFSPSQPSAASTAPTTSSNAFPSGNASFGLGIEGLGPAGGIHTTTAGPSDSASPVKGPMTSLASSFGLMFQDVQNNNKDKQATVEDEDSAEADTKMGGMDEDKDEKEPDDSVMASLEAAEADKPPTDIDIGALTPPCSPVISVQRQRPLKQKQRFRFSMGEAIMSQNDILLNMCNFLGLKDFLNLYCVSKRFYVLVNSHYTTHIKQLARNHAPLAHTIFPYQHYKRACIYDPMQRTRPFHPSDAHPRSRSIILDPTTKAVVRTVPGLRWVLMCAYREALVSDMLLCLALEGHRFPAPVPAAVLKTWALLDQPFNGTRLATVHDPRAWSNRDLFLALMFFVKLDMRFSDPLLGAGECVLRRLLLGQKSLVVLWEALRGLNCRSQAEVLTLLVEWDCAVLRPEQRRSDKTVFGVPPGKVGALSREGWIQSGKPLLRPDQLVLREAVRRGLSMHRCFADFILWGYVDWTWVEDIPLPDLEQLKLMDRKGRGEDVEEDDEGGEGGEDSGGEGGRKVSTGTMREMTRASRVGSA